LDTLLSLQADRTPEQAARCKSEETPSVLLFQSVVGKSFDDKVLPLTFAAIKDGTTRARFIITAAKDFWKRPRPPVADARIHPCVKLEKSASYPSGHATLGIVWGTLLAELFPDKATALMARGNQIGDDRVLAGMHYPSDVAAGKKLGAEIARRLLADPKFQIEFQQAKAECEKAEAENK
jgi:membrane-associated phospholipid phosphatase